MSDDAIPAATILLLRDNPGLEVLMVERHKDIAFAGGAMVFPGGRVDPGDVRPEWRDFARGMSNDPMIAAGEIAAIREAFEETGILLASVRQDDQYSTNLIDGARVAGLQNWRARVEADDALFLQLVRDENLILACDRLALFAHWIAPPRVHKRFDTLFFTAVAPSDQRVEADGNEATDAVWTCPGAALAKAAAGNSKIIFPTARNLELLALSAQSQEVIDYAARRRIEPICPEIVQCGDKTLLTIPDGLGYPVTQEDIATAFRG